MMIQHIDRRRLKADMKDTVRSARVSARRFTALYLVLALAVSLVNYAGSLRGSTSVSLFLSFFCTLLTAVLGAGFAMYCMAIRQGERMEYLAVFDGFSIAGKFIALYLVKFCLVMAWSMLFLIPGFIAAYRYRFAEYNLYENPDLGVFQCLDMSKRQTVGYKSQLLALDLSYFGWACLATLPVIAESYLYAFENVAVELGMAPFLPELSAAQYLVWMVAAGLWQVAVSLFYLPVYRCTELGYYDIAKETSGVHPEDFAREPVAPDGL